MRRLSANEDADTDDDCRYRAVINMSAAINSDSPVRSPPARAIDQFTKKDGGGDGSLLASQFIYSSATTVTSDVQRNCDGGQSSPSRYPYSIVSGGGGSRCGSARSNFGTTSCCGGTREAGGSAVQHNVHLAGSSAGRSMRALYNSNRNALFERSVRAKWRSIKMLFVVVLEFFVCWTPLFVIQTWKVFDDVGASQSVSAGTMNLIHLLAFASSCSNPITYCFMSNRFRQCFIGVFGRCSCRTSNGWGRRGGAAAVALGEGRSWRSGMGECTNRHRQQLSSPPPLHWESIRNPSPQRRSRFAS